MDKYYKYNRETITQLPEGMFCDIFLTFCDPDMRNKLSNIKNVEKMKPEEIWAQVELIFLNSNPMHTRRIQALDTKMVKGESVSDYFIRMKSGFNEADMGKASTGTIMISLLIANLPSDGAEGKIKQELLKLLQKKT